MFSVILRNAITKKGYGNARIDLVDQATGRVLSSFQTDPNGVVFVGGEPKTFVTGVRAVYFRFNGSAQLAPSSSDAALTGQVCP